MTTETKQKHQMAVMGKEGDVKTTWNPDNAEEVKVAEAQFKELTKKGWKAFRMWDDGAKGSQLNKFDKYAENILFVPPIAGG